MTVARKKRTVVKDAPPDDGAFLPDPVGNGEFVGPPAPETLREQLDPEEDAESVGPPTPAARGEPSLASSAEPLGIRAAPHPVTPTAESKVDERLIRLEEALERLQRIEERFAVRAVPAPPVEGGPTLLAGAAALLSGAAALVPAALGGRSPKAPPPGSVADVIAELRASYLMFVDPRYNLTWLGRLAPLALLVMFLMPKWWVPLSWLLPDPFQWAYLSVGQLLASFFLFKIVVHEARRYRATAPDLPPSLKI